MDEYYNLDTLGRIRKCAVEEFMKKGFRGASLRNIVKMAGVTTGAFYGYYKSKEELFDALVGEHADYMVSKFVDSIDDFENFSDEEKIKNISVNDYEYLMDILDYAYDHKDEFKLLILGSSGTKYENFIHNMVEIEIRSTNEFMDFLQDKGYETVDLDSFFEHIVISGMFSSFFETIIHDMPKDRAKRCIQELHAFYLNGWKGFMGL